MTHREEIWNKAQKALFEKYGESPDINIVNHFLTEKMALAHLGVAEYFDERGDFCRRSAEEHAKLICKNTACCCFSAYLLGASEVNPLPPHYYCPSCKRVEWVTEPTCVFDMRGTRRCECGAVMCADGYGLEWELYLPYENKHKEKKDGIFGNRYHDLFESILSSHFQKSLLGATQACHLLGQVTGFPPEKIHFDDNKVKSQLLGGDFSCMHPKLAEFLKQAYEVVKPQSYNELLQLVSFSKGTNTWRNNAEDLLKKNGKCRLADIPASRDEVFMRIRDAMREHGVYDTGFAYDVANKARKGYYFEHGDGYTIDTLKSLGFDDWFASYLLGVRYMSTKALSILELRYIIMLTYFKLYYSHEYQEVIAGEDIWQPH